MSKIISLVIAFLNKINNFIWKIIIFLSKFIKVDEVNHLDDKPDDVKYRLFNIDVPAIIEPFAKSNLSKRIISSQLNAVMAKILLLILSVRAVALLRIIFIIIMAKIYSLNAKFVLIFFLPIIIKRKMVF